MNSRKEDASLIAAITENQQELVEKLLENKANPNCKNEKGVPILNLAVISKNYSITKSLLNAKASVNDQSENSGQTALFSATVSDQHAIIQLLLSKKANPSTPSKLFTTPLLVASIRNQPDIIDTLIRAGATPFNNELHQFLNHPYEEMTLEQRHRALSTIYLMLSHGQFTLDPIFLYHFICSCDQQNPLVSETLTKMCEHPFYSNEKEFLQRKKHVFDPAKEYQNKLAVVLKYYNKTKISPMLTKENVEKTYNYICDKTHPFLSIFKPLGATIDVKPEELKANQIIANK